jgi:hypothetical protein
MTVTQSNEEGGLLMGLPWVRLDTNIASHDKILALSADPSPRRWQALASYCFALAWSGGQGTDGFIPGYALHFVHGSPQTARLLVKYRLWEEKPNGYQIRNYDTRQVLNDVAEADRKAHVKAGRKGNCIRWHGEDCGCWKVTELHG